MLHFGSFVGVEAYTMQEGWRLSLKRFTSLPLQLSFFQKAKISRAVENDVIKQFDAYDVTCRFELGSDLDVAGRWFEAAARVIVGDDDSACSRAQCRSKDLARMDQGCRGGADRNLVSLQQPMTAVQVERDDRLAISPVQ